MQPEASVPLKSGTAPEVFRTLLNRGLAAGFIAVLYVLLPLLPLLASLAYQRRKYALEYRTTLKKMVVHVQAISGGPVLHYLEDIAGKQAGAPPAAISGECTQCGNCCLDKRCVFLERTAQGKHICGVYHAPLRRFSNCGSFPISAHDIQRYDCPGYTLTEAPIHWVR